MAYTPREIKDRVAVGDDIFIVEDLGNNRIKLIPAPTHVSEPGTPINKALLQPIEDELGNLSATKVDKVSGKGLSTNDFTDALKNKLDGIEEGAQVNVVNSVSSGTAFDGDYIPLNFKNMPKIMLIDNEPPFRWDLYNTYSPEFNVTRRSGSPGNFSEGTYEVCVTSMYGRLEAAPRYIKQCEISGDEAYMYVTWTAEKNATAYCVYFREFNPENTQLNNWYKIAYIQGTSLSIWSEHGASMASQAIPAYNETGIVYQERKVYPYNISRDGFSVRAQIVVPGVETTENINQTLSTVGQSYTTAMLDPQQQSITSYDVQGTLGGTLSAKQGFPGSAEFTVSIKLDLLNANDQILTSREITYGWEHGNVPFSPWVKVVNEPFRFHVSPPVGSFKARLTLTNKTQRNNNWTWTPKCVWKTHTYNSDQVVAYRWVEYIAIDGGPDPEEE